VGTVLGGRRHHFKLDGYAPAYRDTTAKADYILLVGSNGALKTTLRGKTANLNNVRPKINGYEHILRS
jgi:hypothetical protein